MRQLIRYKKNQKFICSDGETCNLSLSDKNNKIWQLSFVTFTLDKILEKFDFYPWWDDLNVGKGAARVTNFNYEEYHKKASDPVKILDTFESYLFNPEYISVGHNHYNFDFFLYNIYRKILGREPKFDHIYNGAIDTNAVAKCIEMGISIPEDKNDFISLMYQMASHKDRKMESSIGFLLKKYNLPHDPLLLHNGLEDCLNNINIFKKQIWDIEI